jgi:hypothetical protein
MNTQQAMTAGKTAIENLRASILSERKSIAQNIINNTSLALVVYYDENCNIKVLHVTPDGCETEVLEMLMNLSSATKTMVQDYIGD